MMACKRSLLFIPSVFLLLFISKSIAKEKQVSTKNIGFERAMTLSNKMREKNRSRHKKRELYSKLLSKAQPLRNFNSKQGRSDPTQGRQLEEDDVDDYYNNDDDQYGNFGFDATQYSLKYTRCQAIESYSDEIAEENDVDTVLQTERFVVFRLCPTDNCVQGSKYGCDQDFGDYIITMDAYFEAMKEYTNDMKEGYCDYCEECAQNRKVRRLDEAGDDAAGDDAAGDDAAGDDAAGDDAYYNAACNVCDEDTYNAKCYEADDDYQVDYQDVSFLSFPILVFREITLHYFLVIMRLNL